MATAKKLTERHLSCSICTDVFKDPATLQCNHTFCKSCLLNYVSIRPAAIKTKSIPCPTCRQLTLVTNPHRPVEEWVNQLKPSHVIQGLMDDFGPNAEPPDEHVCSVCTKQGKTTPATDGCSFCNVVLCDECFKSRNMESGLCDHDVAQLSDHTEPKVMCEHHTDKQLELFCRDCKLEICTICRSLNHRTCRDIGTVENVTPLLREQLTNKLEQLHTNMSVIDKILTRRKSEIENIKSRSKNLSDQVMEARETAVGVILRKEKQLLDSIHKATGELLREYESDIQSQETQLQVYQQEYVITADALTSSCLKDMYAGLGSVDESVVKRPAAGRLVFTQDLDKLKKAADDLQLGKVKFVHDASDHESSPFLLRTIHCKEDGNRKKPDLFDVTVLTVDGIKVTLVADFDNKKLKTYHTSNLKSCHSQLLLSNGPWQIAKYSESQVFVSIPDSKEIVTVNCSPAPVLRSIIRTNKVYCALAYLNPSQLVASIYEQPSSVDVLDMSGRVLRSVTNKILRTPDYIHVTSSKNLIVSARAVTSLVCVTSNGDTVFSYTPTGNRALTYPWGITTTCSGDILLVDYDSKVIQLTESGQFVRDVLTRRDGVDSIRAVSVDDDGLMYVMSDRSVKVFEFR